MTAEPARQIPPRIQREVRQRCGFGCVICGMPLYEYEHMREWSEVQEHDPSEITLLCDQHHRERTGGLLPIEAVRAANDDPINKRSGASKPYTLHFGGGSCEVDLGSNVFEASAANDMAVVMIDGTPLVGFRFEDGHYLLNVLLFDELNELVLRIVDNELVYSSQPWDIELVGPRLVIRAASRSIFIDLEFQPPNKVRFQRGRLLHNGVELFVRPGYLLLMNNCTLLRSNRMSGCIVGLNVGADHLGLPSAIRVAGLRRYGVDRPAALRWVREQISEAEAEAAFT